MPSPCLPHPPRPSVFCGRCPGNPMGGMQIRGTGAAAAPCLPSPFAPMMTNTFVHGEGRWELQSAPHHCPSQISSVTPPRLPASLYSSVFTCFHYFQNASFHRTCHFSAHYYLASPAQLAGFARGQCYPNRPIGLFAIAPSIKQEAPRMQPITSISRDSIR